MILVPLLVPDAAWGQAYPDRPSTSGTADDGCRISDAPQLEWTDETDDVIELTSGDAEISASGDATFTGPVELSSANRSLTAGTAKFDSAAGKFSVSDNVQYIDPDSRISGDAASFNTATGKFVFEGADFQLWNVPARGSASSITVSQAGVLELKGVEYTTCAVGSNDWFLRAGSIEIDQNKGMGTARHARIALAGVPVFYWPYFTYPVTDQRKSGLLLPDVGSSEQRGFEISTPYYWNIAPRYDATFVPRYMGKRGLQIGTEFRYLTRSNDGILWGDYLADDDETGDERWRYIVATQSLLGRGWRATIAAEGVSDSDYFQDLSSGQAATSQTNLERALNFEWFNYNWAVRFRVQDFQTIDDAIAADDEPYRRVPQLAIDGEWRDGLLGLDYGLVTDATYFDRTESLTGLRVHLRPEVSWPWERNGLYAKPAAAVFYSTYKLDDQPAPMPDDPDVAAPVFSFDTGLVLERQAGSAQQWLATIEPRMLYTYVPFEDQTDIPVFDTIVPDFNLVQLFRENRFVGYDRIGDTNQLSIGLTGRILDSATGTERLTATIGGRQYFSTREVTLPGELPADANSSDYIAELGVKLYKKWNLDFGYLWNTEENQTTRAEARVQWRPGSSTILNLAYRFRRDRLKQADASFLLPLGERWNFVGRYSYSLEDSEPLDRFFGIEYSTCCWGVRVIARNDVGRNVGESNSSVAVQLELKNFTSVGNSADSLLERGILGYGAD